MRMMMLMMANGQSPMGSDDAQVRRAAVLLLRSAVNSLGAEWFCSDPRSMVRLRSELVRIAGCPTAVGLDGGRLLPISGRCGAVGLCLC